MARFFLQQTDDKACLHVITRFMRYIFIYFFLMLPLAALSQREKEKKNNRFDGPEKYVSLNFFSIAEPQLALGPSFGIRFTKRSEVFTEAAYVAKSPFYKNYWDDYRYLHGARFILQYRYHFLQQWRPLLNFGAAYRHMRSRHQPFAGIEFRVKPISFSTTGYFINNSTNDTLYNFSFRAKALTYGGALIFGNTFNLTKDGKWKLEFSAGIGAKQRVIGKTTIPAGYKRPLSERVAFQIPPLYEELGTALTPCALRLRYVLD